MDEGEFRNRVGILCAAVLNHVQYKNAKRVLCHIRDFLHFAGTEYWRLPPGIGRRVAYSMSNIPAAAGH